MYGGATILIAKNRKAGIDDLDTRDREHIPTAAAEKKIS